MWSRDLIRPTDMVLIVAVLLLGLSGVAMLGRAVWFERRMHQHRQPGVSYWQATLRRDGAWRRSDLFTDAGLVLQKKASTAGVIGAALLLLAVGLLGVSRFLP